MPSEKVRGSPQNFQDLLSDKEYFHQLTFPESEIGEKIFGTKQVFAKLFSAGKVLK